MFLRRKLGSSTSDEDLVAAVRDGHQPALGTLWDRYAHLLFGVCMKYLKDTERSKDLVADLFADLPALLGRHAVERFRPWVHTVMRNRCLLFLRAHRPAAWEMMDQLEQEPDTTDDRILYEADLQRLEQAIAQLNDDQRTCIRLFHLERHSYHDTAMRTGLSVEQVRSHLQNGRRNLRIMLVHPHAHEA